MGSADSKPRSGGGKETVVVNEEELSLAEAFQKEGKPQGLTLSPLSLSLALVLSFPPFCSSFPSSSPSQRKGIHVVERVRKTHPELTRFHQKSSLRSL
jgi:hypothetical protein